MRKHSISFKGSKVRTEQHHKKSCCIRNIDAQYRRTGVLPQPKPGLAFRDMTVVPDFQTAMNVIAESKSSFQRLPANLRAKFDNNPDKFVSYVHDPRNHDDLIAMGFATKIVPPAPPEPLAVRVVDGLPPAQ